MGHIRVREKSMKGELVLLGFNRGRDAGSGCGGRNSGCGGRNQWGNLVSKNLD